MEQTAHYYINPIVYDGRPSQEEGRLSKEIRVYDLLDSLHIPYKRVDHDALPTIEACHEVDLLLDIDICKNLFLCNTQKTAFYFASPEYMEQLLDITPGSVSVLGLMNDHENRVRLLIDRDVLENHEFLGCHPCINTSSLKLRTRDLLETILPAIHHQYTVVDLPNE